MSMTFTPAVRTQRRLRLALVGTTGSGKTMSALKIARGIARPEGRIAVVDTENASASLYSDGVQFDSLQLASFAPDQYVKAIKAAEDAGYDVLVIDSLSHAWAGKDGALEMVDKKAAQSRSGNSFEAWRHVTPQHNLMVEALIRCKMHLIVTMRVKTEYVMEKDERTGKMAPRKVGLAPVMRDGVEYEFDVVGDMADATLSISKTRYSALHGSVIVKPDESLGKDLITWLKTGKLPDPEPEHKAPAAPATKPPASKVEAAVETKTVKLLEIVAKPFTSNGRQFTIWKITAADDQDQQAELYTLSEAHAASVTKAKDAGQWCEIDYRVEAATNRKNLAAIRPVQLRDGTPTGQRVVAPEIREEDIPF